MNIVWDEESSDWRCPSDIVAADYHAFVDMMKTYDVLCETCRTLKLESAFSLKFTDDVIVHGLDDSQEKLRGLESYLNQNSRSRFAKETVADLNEFVSKLSEAHWDKKTMGSSKESKAFRETLETFLNKALLENDLDHEAFIAVQKALFSYLSARKSDKIALYNLFGVADEAALFEKIDQIFSGLGLDMTLSFSSYRQLIYHSKKESDQQKMAKALREYVDAYFNYDALAAQGKLNPFSQSSDIYRQKLDHLQQVFKDQEITINKFKSVESVFFNMFQKDQNPVFKSIIYNIAELKTSTNNDDRLRLLNQIQSLAIALSISPQNEILFESLKRHMRQFFSASFDDLQVMFKHASGNEDTDFLEACKSPLAMDDYLDAHMADFRSQYDMTVPLSLEDTPRSEFDFLALRSCKLLLDKAKVGKKSERRVLRYQKETDGSYCFVCEIDKKITELRLSQQGDITSEPKQDLTLFQRDFKQFRQALDSNFELEKKGLSQILEYDPDQSRYVFLPWFRERFHMSFGFEALERRLHESEFDLLEFDLIQFTKEVRHVLDSHVVFCPA